jgi:hypothetical protein
MPVESAALCPPGFREVRVYAWTDEGGVVQYETVRFEHLEEFQEKKPDRPKKSFQFRRPVVGQPGRYMPSLGDVSRVVFRKDRLAVHPNETLHWTEGEDHVEALEALGFLATTTAGGAGGVRAYSQEELRWAAHGRDVVLHADADRDGEAYVAFVASNVASVASSIRIVRYRDFGPGGDVLDFIRAGATREQLQQLVSIAPLWEPGTRDSEDSEDCESALTTWSSPIPLWEGERPEFPTSLLPEPLASYVSALAVATQTPPVLAALSVLGTVAIAAAKRFTVHPRPGWVEPINVYTLVSLGSGNRKSAVIDAVGRPLREYEDGQAEALAVEIAQTRARREMEEKRLERFQRDYSRENNEDKRLGLWSDIRDLTERLETDPQLQVPTAPRLLVDDITPERLAALMADNHGRMGVLSAEGGIFQIIAGRYKDKGAESLDLFLKGHSGDDMPIDRVNRATKPLRAPALTMALAVQPDVLAGLAAHRGFRGQGLLARFWYACPISTVGRRQIAPPPVSPQIEQAYSDLIAGILRRPESEEPLTLSPPASVVMITFERDLEPRLGPDGDLEFLADWGGKLAGQVARLAGLLHVVQSVTNNLDPQSRPISADTIHAAVELAETFLIPHAKTAFTLMGADPAVEQARRLVREIAAWPQESVSRRDLHQKLRATYTKPEELDRPLAVLEDHGYIRRVGQEAKGPGRKPSPRFDINPLGRAQNSQNAQYSQLFIQSEDIEDSEAEVTSQNGHRSAAVADPWAGAQRLTL